jgi:hypothetical protein
MMFIRDPGNLFPDPGRDGVDPSPYFLDPRMNIIGTPMKIPERRRRRHALGA